MKAKNPQTPIMIREAMDVEPKVWARYEYGKEKMIPLKGGFAIRSWCTESGRLTVYRHG